MNDIGTMLVSGGTEKVMNFPGFYVSATNGQTYNVRVLLLDSTVMFCLFGFSDSMIRLWDLGQQQCVHTRCIQIMFGRLLACTPSFSHVYSDGRDQCANIIDRLGYKKEPFAVH